MPRRNTVHQLPELDALRSQHGSQTLRSIFYDLAANNSEYAAGLLNADSLAFPTLYVLQPEIKKFGLYPLLNDRNREALQMCESFALSQQPGGYQHKMENYPTLRWMFRTGYQEPALGDLYDEVMDTAAIFLIKVHGDKECLPMIEQMIFDRYRVGAYIYDAVWAFFESGDPQTLIMVADRLKSNDPKDVELARNLLGFMPCFGRGYDTPARQHRCVLNWVSQNKPYLKYTGDHNQCFNNPNRFKVSLDNKYRHRPVRPEPEGVSQQNVGQELTRLSFSRLDEDLQRRLAGYSFNLYRKNISRWRRWMSKPLERQIAEMGGEVPTHD